MASQVYSCINLYYTYSKKAEDLKTGPEKFIRP